MASDKQQQEWLFDKDEHWKEHWKGMPEFSQQDLTPFKSIAVHFESLEAMESFSKLMGQKITTETRSIWHPKAEIGRYANKRFVDEPKPK